MTSLHTDITDGAPLLFLLGLMSIGVVIFTGILLIDILVWPPIAKLLWEEGHWPEAVVLIALGLAAWTAIALGVAP